MSEDLSADMRKLLEQLQEMNGRSSNADLRSELKWSSEKYFDVRNSCRASGLVGVARGRGGVVFLTDAARPRISKTVQDEIGIKAESDEFDAESQYYDILQKAIKTGWVESEGFDSYVVEITANRRVRGAGRWTVPDIVIVGKVVRQYVPGMEFTVQSIEVKRFEALDALSVFESLSHRRSSHYAYLLVVNSPVKRSSKDSDKIGQIAQLCEEHDVGLVIVKKGDEGKFDEWEFEVLSSGRTEPDPDNLDGFVKQFMSPESRDAIARMVR